MWLLTYLTLFLCDLNVNFLFCTDVVLGCERSLQACSSWFLPPVVFSGSAVNDLDSRWFFGSTLFFFGDCISPLCVMKFTHILKAWLAYILYWHSGNMFPLSLFIYLSFPLSLCTLLSLSPRPPPPLCVCVALWSSAVLFSVIFIGATRGRHIAAIIYSKEKKTHTSPQTAGFFFSPRFIFVHFHSSAEPRLKSSEEASASWHQPTRETLKMKFSVPFSLLQYELWFRPLCVLV